MMEKGLWDRILKASLAQSVANFRARQAPGMKLQIEAPKADPYSRNADEINSIAQSGARGFRTFDIDPNALSREQFGCVVDISTLSDLTGYELRGVQQGWNVESDQLPFWRTVSLGANGNWIKIEYLPSRVNDALSFDLKHPDWTALPEFPSPTVPGTEDTLSPYSPIVKWASSRIVIAQFDDTASAPIVIRPGETVKIPFNTVYLTFKVWSPRIRVTVGYNSEISSSFDERVMNSKVAYGPGYGLFDKPYIHAVPFEIETEDLGDPDDLITLNFGNPTFTEELIVNAANSPNGDGLCCGWLTHLNVSAWLETPGTNAQGRVEVFIANFPFTTKRRRLLSMPLMLWPGGGSERQVNLRMEPREPVRFTIHSGECLVIRFEVFPNAGGFDVDCRFSLGGYVWGGLGGVLTVGEYLTPFVPLIRLTEEPYPMDRGYIAAPGAGV